MATPSHITMLREISAAGDRERTGALDVEWDGAHATLFFMFGHPSHVVFEAGDGRKLAGEEALGALVEELPHEFRVAPWRRAMVTDDTLHCTAEDLMGLFQRRTNVEPNEQAAAPTETSPAPATDEPAPAADAQPAAPTTTAAQPPFGMGDFVLLPASAPLWSDAAANVVANLEAAIPRMPDSLIVLTAAACQGALVIEGGRISDAVWVSPAGGSLGQEAAQSLTASTEGTLTAYRIDGRMAAALPMLWRAQRPASTFPAGWLSSDNVVAEVRTSGRSCGLIVDSDDPGVALFDAGDVVAVYSAGSRRPEMSTAALRALLKVPGARVSVLDGLTTTAAPSAVDAKPGGEDAASVQVAAETPPAVATAESAATAGAAARTTTAEAASQAEAEPATAEPAAADATADADAGAETAATTEPGAAPEATTGPDGGTEPVTTPSVDAQTDAEPVAEPKPRSRRTRSEPTYHVQPVAPKEDDQATHAIADTESAAPAESTTNGSGSGTAVVVTPIPTGSAGNSASSAASATDATTADSDGQTERPTGAEVGFGPAMFTIAPDASASEAESSGMAAVEAREATEFVPARLDIDVDSLRAELEEIAVVWLGPDDSAPVAKAIGSARPGVDDFVSTIAAIGAMDIPGHETAVVRAMAREMHFRASEVLCGV